MSDVKLLKVTIPKQDFQMASFPGRDGNPVPVTKFLATLSDGSTIKCDLSGRDIRSLLEQHIGKPDVLEFEGEYNERYKNYKVKLPRTGGGFGGKNFGGGKTWTKNGYEGQPVKRSEWWQITRDLMPEALNVVVDACAKIGIEASPSMILESAQDLLSQFWIQVEKNVALPDDNQRIVKPAESAAPATSSATPSPQPPKNPEPTPQARAYKTQIDESSEDGEFDAIMTEVRRDQAITQREREALLKIAMKKKQEIAVARAANGSGGDDGWLD